MINLVLLCLIIFLILLVFELIGMMFVFIVLSKVSLKFFFLFNNNIKLDNW